MSTTAEPAPSHYDRHYKAGGFGYEAKRRKWVAWVKKHHVKRFGMTGKVLDAACGNGFWTDVLRQLGLDAQGFDLSAEGIRAACAQYPKNAYTEGNAEIEIASFVGQFDWVFVRGISHLHRTRLDTDEARAMVRTLLSYTKPGGKMLHSYHTTQDGTNPKGNHFNHTLGDLAKLMETAGTVVDASVVDDFVQLVVARREQS